MLLGVCTVALLAGVLSLWWSKPLLFVEGGNPHADVIVILGGDAGDRTFRGLELYRANAAPKILISGDGDCFLIRSRLVLAGVNTNAILMEPFSRNTKQNAEFSVHLLRQKGMKRAIIVTSWFHSRRALACFRRFGSGIEFASFPAYHGVSMDHKPYLTELPNVAREYLALGWYLLRYQIAPITSVSLAN